MEIGKVKDTLEARLGISFIGRDCAYPERYFYYNNGLTITIVGGRASYYYAEFDGEIETSFWVHYIEKSTPETLDKFIEKVKGEMK